MNTEGAGRALREAEDHLRALGLTGGQAFDRLMDALTEPERHPDVLQACPMLARLVASNEAFDWVDLAYERFFSDRFKGERGQFFTPPALIRLMLSLARLAPGERVLDPTAGSGALVVAAARAGADAQGLERDPGLVRLGNAQLQRAGLAGHVTQGNCFTADVSSVDVVLANPPFSLDIDDPDLLESSLLAHGRGRLPSEWLFVERAGHWVRPGGRMVVLLPHSVVANPSAQSLRDHLDAHWTRQAMVLFPEGVFRPFGGAAGRAVMLLLQRASTLGPVRWASVTDPGYDPSRRRYKPTSGRQLEALGAGEGWSILPAGSWQPAKSEGGPSGSERSLAELATVRAVRATDGSSAAWSASLADSDRRTGELAPRPVAEGSISGPRQVLQPGQVVVSRLRPDLNRVAVVPSRDGPMVGSLEWIPLQVRVAPHFVLHALRTPAWRRGIPLTRGQTRPRFHADEVLAQTIRWPGDALASRVHRISHRIHAARAELRAELEDLQSLIDAYADGRIDEDTLEMRLREWERPG